MKQTEKARFKDNNAWRNFAETMCKRKNLVVLIIATRETLMQLTYIILRPEKRTKENKRICFIKIKKCGHIIYNNFGNR